MTDTSTLRSVLSDAELIVAARADDGEAYGELYIRHLQSAQAAARALTRSRSDADDIVAEAFSRVLSVLHRGGGPDISFRPYLLTTVRNTFYERTRRTRLEDVTDRPDDSVNFTLLDAATSNDDHAMVATAFAILPERWQLVLWHTEVEGRSAAEVAPLLGIAPNAVAALAYRAREGLRQAYLQSHLRTPLADDCRECVSNLGAYVRDTLSLRDRRKVDDHLAICTSCPPLLAELSDANSKLRGVLIPILIGVPAAKYVGGLAVGKGVVATVKRMPRVQQVAIGSVAASAFAALAIVAASLAGPDESGQRLVASDPPVVVTVATTTAETRRTPSTGADLADADRGSATETRATDRDDSTPSNTQQIDTSDTGYIGPVPDSVDIPLVVPVQTTPNTPVRTTPTTQPRTPTTQPRSPVVISPATATTTATTTATATATTTATTTPPGTTTATTTPPTSTATTSTTEATTTTTSDETTTTTVAPAAEPRVGAELVGRAYAGGSALIRINTANGTTPGGGSFRAPQAGPAGAVRVTMELPTGVSFASVDDPAWNCSVAGGSTTMVCEIPGLADGARSSADIKLGIGAVESPFSLTPMISADGATPVAAAGPLVVEVSTIENSLFADYDTGSVMIVGNGSMTCDARSEQNQSCLGARGGKADLVLDLNRHNHHMVHVDIDSDRETFNSSSARLTLGSSTVSRAFLVWGGDTLVGETRSPNPSRANNVRLTTPDGEIHDVLATTVSRWDDESLYSAYADVTSLVQASGAYQVADVQAAQGRGGMAGWSLVVVTHDPSDPMRLLAVTAPGALLDSKSSYSLSVPLDAHVGPRAVTVGIASFEGELGIYGDRVTIGSDLTVTNPFDSSVMGRLDPLHDNNFGVDSDLFSTDITDTVLRIEASSEGDQAWLSLFAISADL